MTIQIDRTAIISECGKYRYLLRRVWNDNLTRALFVMLNPSTADGKIDDPTIRACTRWCTTNGFGSFEVVNLFAIRSTQPEGIYQVRDPIGPQNEAMVDRAVKRADVVICAWGAHLVARDHAPSMVARIRKEKAKVYCLGLTKIGAPLHPLYVANNQPLIEYNPRRDFRHD